MIRGQGTIKLYVVYNVLEVIEIMNLWFNLGYTLCWILRNIEMCMLDFFSLLEGRSKIFPEDTFWSIAVGSSVYIQLLFIYFAIWTYKKEKRWRNKNLS